MTVASEVYDIEYATDGVTTAFAIPFNFLSNSDIEVSRRDSTGDSTVLATGYSITGAGTGSGTCTISPALASGYTIRLERKPQIHQPMDLTANDSFPAETVEAAHDRQAYISQYLRALIARCIQVPAGDGSIDGLELAAVSARASTILGFDSAGNLDYLTSIGSTVLSQAVIGGYLYPRTAAEIAAGVTPVAYYYAPGDVRRHGAVGDGTTSDYAAWINAALVGGEITVPPNFNSAIASASLGSAGIPLLSNTVIRGAGRDTSKITVTGATACNLFRTLNKKGVKFRDITLRQNGVNTSTSLGEIVYFDQSSAAAAVGGDLSFIRCRFENCKADNWIGFYNSGTTYAMRGLRVMSCEFLSESGNARGPTTSGVSSSCITVGDSASASTQLISDIHIRDNTVDGTHIKTFVEVWHNASGVKIRSNICRNFHSAAAFSVEDVGLYVITIYKGAPGTSIAPDLIDVSGNTFNGFKDCGLYVQTANRLRIAGNDFVSGTGTTDATLPKGAIAINQTTRARVLGNSIDACARGVSLVVGSSQVFSIRDTSISAPVASAVSFKATAAAGTTSGKLYVDGIEIQTGTTTVGMDFDFGATFGLAVLDVRNFSVEGSTSSIRFRRSDTTTPAMDEVVFQNGSVRGGATYGLQFENYADTDQRATFANITISDISSTAYGLSLDASTGLDVSGITLRDVGTSAFGLSTAGATGTLAGIRFQNVADADRIRSSGGTDLGRSTPTHSGNIGDFIQNCNPVDRDASNMFLRGWQNYNGSTGWRTLYESTVSPAT